MKKISKKIASLISGLLPILSVTGKTNAMIERTVTPDWNTIKSMMGEAWSDNEKTFEDKLEHPISYFQKKYGMYPTGPGKLGLRALNKVSNNRKTASACVLGPPALLLAYKYSAFDKIGDIVKNCISGNKTQFKDYENQYNEQETDDSDASTDSEDD